MVPGSRLIEASPLISAYGPMTLSRLPPLPKPGLMPASAPTSRLPPSLRSTWQPSCKPITKVPESTGTERLPSTVAAALPVTKPSLVKAVAAMFGTELMVILVSAALRCQPSSVSADWVTSATGRGSAADTPSARERRATATAPARRSVSTRAILKVGAEWFLAPDPRLQQCQQQNPTEQ